MVTKRSGSGSSLEASVCPPSKPGDDGYDDWLLDASIEETFPASDAVLATRPGSTLSRRNQAARKE